MRGQTVITMEKCQWVKLPEAELERRGIFHGKLGTHFALFRCGQIFPENARLTAGITAVSRYRLWVNGRPVLSGPCKGDLNRQYFETVELTPYLKSGKNVFAVQVWYNDPDMARDQTDSCAAIYGVVGAGREHMLALEGEVRDASGRKIGSVSTGEADWRVKADPGVSMHSTEFSVYLGAVEETADFRLSPSGWKTEEFDASDWEKAACHGPVVLSELFRSVGLVPRVHVLPREIPLLDETEERFAESFLRDDFLILDAGAHVNGYPRFMFEGRAGTEIDIVYMERFGDGREGRIDDRTGSIQGRTDHIILGGEKLCYEPFWVRTFRYIAIRGARPCAYMYRRTGYPLETETEITSSEPWVNRVWSMCVRTLRNCMLETYMDCPYYEQLQFIMDTRLQMLFSYAVSRDLRLAEKALLDFHCGMLPDGLLPGKTPSSYLQVISTFSLHYAFALCEYMEHTGRMDLVRKYRPDIDRILDAYDRCRDGTGLVGRIAPWAFMDWQDDWQKTGGVSPAYFEGPSTILNLMYAWALECGARIYERTGRPGTAEEYRLRRREILENVKTLCYDREKGMLREGPACAQFTRHAQAWAVVNGLFDRDEGRRALQSALSCPPCSFAASYEWFQALESVGMESEIRAGLQAWIGLIGRGSTTCPEEPGHPRSECHAWSALPLDTFPHVLAGIRMQGGEIAVRPHLFDLPDLAGTVLTAVGPVRFRYAKAPDGACTYEITLPEGTRGRLILDAGKETVFSGTYMCTKAAGGR